MSSSPVEAVRNSTGILAALDIWRTRWMTSKPSIPGIMTSSTIASYLDAWASSRATASSPDDASWQTNPALFSQRVTMSRVGASSSTTNTSPSGNGAASGDCCVSVTEGHEYSHICTVARPTARLHDAGGASDRGADSARLHPTARSAKVRVTNAAASRSPRTPTDGPGPKTCWRPPGAQAVTELPPRRPCPTVVASERRSRGLRGDATARGGRGMA